jgi:hypothetical protein
MFGHAFATATVPFALLSVACALGGLDIDFAVVRWAIPLAAGILASGLVLAGHRASIFDLFVPAAGGLVLVALGLGGIRLSAYVARA